MRQRGVATVWQVGGASIAAFVGLWLTPTTGSLARAETPEVSPAGAIGLGNRGWSAAETNHATSANELEFSAAQDLHPTTFIAGRRCSNRGPRPGPQLKARIQPALRRRHRGRR